MRARSADGEGCALDSTVQRTVDPALAALSEGLQPSLLLLPRGLGLAHALVERGAVLDEAEAAIDRGLVLALLQQALEAQEAVVQVGTVRRRGVLGDAPESLLAIRHHLLRRVALCVGRADGCVDASR
jgi:hypothetical protein